MIYELALASTLTISFLSSFPFPGKRSLSSGLKGWTQRGYSSSSDNIILSLLEALGGVVLTRLKLEGNKKSLVVDLLSLCNFSNISNTL